MFATWYITPLGGGGGGALGGGGEGFPEILFANVLKASTNPVSAAGGGGASFIPIETRKESRGSDFLSVPRIFFIVFIATFGAGKFVK